MNNTMTLKIKGMACNVCAQKIQEALAKARDVEEVQVDFRKKRAFLKTRTKDKTHFLKLIRALGYDAA
jgi:copper chaperone CopZ